VDGSAVARAIPGLVAAPPLTGRVHRSSLDIDRWSPLQRASQAVVRLLFRLLAPVTVEGLENIPRSGAMLLAANHLSLLDVPVLFTVLPRRGICIATESLRRHFWARWFLDMGDTIYVRRGEADREALARSLAVLRAGGLLGVAPEGTRSRTGGLAKGLTGVAYLAAEAGAPVLPIAAYGQEQIAANLRRLRRTRVHVRIGAPIALSPGDRTAARLEQDTARVMTAVAALLPPAYRGVYAAAVERAHTVPAEMLFPDDLTPPLVSERPTR
jgi:1-acyl-sn-glycerol-3-phosphate acyltransferase